MIYEDTQIGIMQTLSEAEADAAESTKERLTHDEVFASLRNKINAR